MSEKKAGFREAKYLGELPRGYEYKFLFDGINLKVIGVAHDKRPIGFIITNEKLEKIKLE